MSKVTLFVVPGCVHCMQARAFLQSQGVAFTEINALDAPKSLVKMPSGIRPEFPIVKIGQEILRRPDLDELAAALGRNP